MKLFKEYYTKEFYDRYVDGSYNSAKIILNLLYQIYQPKSVIEFGCGRGAWLKIAESLGSEKLKGYDGNWIERKDLLSKNIDFSAVDFEKDQITIEDKYDLCMSLEVAEHISKKNAISFINTLCKASNVVLFSAAIKYQIGDNHINEQFPSYWANLFEKNNFACFDIFRGEIWNNEEISWWYRQNILLFVNQLSPFINMEGLKITRKPVIDIIHPLLYESKITRKEKRAWEKTQK